MVSIPQMGLAGSARDYLNAPIDTWLTFYNFGYFASVTPEDGVDVTSSIRSNVYAQSVVITRTMDFWGRTAGISAILPYVALDASSTRSALRTRASRMSAFSCRRTSLADRR